MAVEIGSHSDSDKVYKRSQRGLFKKKKKNYITVTSSSSLPKLQNGVARQCPNNVGHTSLSCTKLISQPLLSLSYISMCLSVNLTGIS